MKVNKNWNYLYLNCISFFKYFFTTSNKVKNKLKIEIQNCFESIVNINLFKSGRSSIYTILIELNKKGYNIVLIPYRLCNVVEVAAKNAGFDTLFYKNEEDLLSLIQNKDLQKQQTVLLTAAYFNHSINREKVVSIFLNKFNENAPVIFDECQSLFSFSLFKKHIHLDNKFLVISFNDKFIPGAMGAALISKELIKTSKLKLKFKEEMYFLAILIKSCLDFIKPLKNKKIKGEFSSCKGLRYNIKPHDISKASAIVALEFLKKKDKINQQLEKNNFVLNQYFKRNKLSIKIFYLCLQESIPPNHPIIKGPYLCYENENLHKAIEETGGIFVTNSFKYKLK